MLPVPAVHHRGGVGGPLYRRRPWRRPGDPAEVLDRWSSTAGSGASASCAPPPSCRGKNWETFEQNRVPLALRQQLDKLAVGGFVDCGVNVLAFGLPRTDKTHALCAIGHRLMQDLLAANRDLALPRQLWKLDSYDFPLLDDLGYLPQKAEESEVFFTLTAERYERRSLAARPRNADGV